MRASRIATAVVAVLVIVAVALFVARTVPRPDGARATSPGKPASGSVAADWYDLFFTQPLIPDRKELHHGGLDERLVAMMDEATISLDVADYDFDLENVALAMAKALARGVRVRMVTDTDTLEDRNNQEIQHALQIVREAGIGIVGDNRQPIMHHKFVVKDGAEVWTGSWNFTDGDTYRLNNNSIRIRSPQLAANFSAEFEKMFVKHEFGPSKSPGDPNPTITVGGATIEMYFSPRDRPARPLAARIRAATKSVHFLAFSFTHDDLGQAVMERQKAGVEVVGVFEKTGSETAASEYPKMKAAGLEVYQDGSPYVMHHKVFVLDGRTTAFGSFNFSSNADRDNDENLLIVDDPGLATQFEAEFQRMVALAKQPAPRRASTPDARPR
ncbi:MAG: phospholipase [Chloroflexi bacterium]|nr:phospholipase [Chloroflexota bacterium]